MYKTVPITKNDLAPNVIGAEVEKSCSRPLCCPDRVFSTFFVSPFPGFLSTWLVSFSLTCYPSHPVPSKFTLRPWLNSVFSSLGTFPLTKCNHYFERMTPRLLLLDCSSNFQMSISKHKLDFSVRMSHCHLKPNTPESEPTSMPSPLKTSSRLNFFCPQAHSGRLRYPRHFGLVCSIGNYGQPDTKLFYPCNVLSISNKVSLVQSFSP